MDQWKLWIVQLLPLCWCSNSEVTLVKTIGSEPDVTPLCTNKTLKSITLIVCKIRTERNEGEECSLLYRYGQEFEHGCDSRFTLMEENQTVFLHLTSLTPVDSGNSTCECSYPGGIDILHLDITVEVVLNQTASYEQDFSSSPDWMFYVVIGGAAAFIIVTGVVLGCVLRRKPSRDDTRSGASVLSVCETPCSLDQYDPDDPYTSLQQPESDLYQTLSSEHHEDDTKRNSASNNLVTAHLDNQEVDARETDLDCDIYENI